ncbi:MAG: DNA-cytosine methyltransferase [Caulobacter sp.]|nr:DNA-cytosine methyltransferase [Caulobacter sp.]
MSSEADDRAVSAPGSVVDLFCGVGGLTHGLRKAGFRVEAGIDLDEQCRYPFEQNNGARFLLKDVVELKGDDLAQLFEVGQPKILVGCAPCQPFSTYNQKNDDPKWRLVERFGELISEIKPDIVSMENVPRLLEFQGGKVFEDFRATLETAGYQVQSQVVFLPDYGLPQRRSRLVLLASQHGPISLGKPTHRPEQYRTVKEAIGKLPPIEAGGRIDADPLHTSSRLSPINLRRIRASTPGGSWNDWDDELVAKCHTVQTGKGYRSVYGRMRMEEPSPTITTQFFGFGNGRFGHPEQDRGLSLREGAILQSFPADYQFFRRGERVQFKALGRLIGNAVPVLLGQVIGTAIKTHLEQHGFKRDA